MDYGDILKRAWNTIWKHKILWVFGLLASCTVNSGGGGGGGGGGRANSNFHFNNGDFFNNNNFPNNFGHNFGHEFGNMDGFNHMFGGGNEVMVIMAIILGVFCLMLILSAIKILIGSAGQIGLTRGAWWVDEGETEITFGRIWQSIGKPYWRVVLLHLALALIDIVLMLIIVVGVILFALVLSSFGAIGVKAVLLSLLCFVPILCILALPILIVTFLVGIIIQFMIVMMVNDDVTLLDAVKKSYLLLRDNFWHSVLLGIILFLIQMVVQFIVTVPVMLIFAGTIGAAAITSGIGNMGPGVIAILLLCMVCLILPIALFVSAITISYTGSAWTITYRRLTDRAFGGASENLIVEADPAEEPAKAASKTGKASAAEAEPPADEAPKKPRQRRKKTESNEDKPE